MTDDEGWTALHYSAREGSYESIKSLLAMGTNINLKTNNGKNCLHIAAAYDHINLSRTLISKHNFDVQLPDHDEWTALHFFAQNGSYELLKAVEDMGIDIKLETNYGRNCLHIAAKNSRFNLCRTLLDKHNFDVELPDRGGWTALHYFAQNGSYELVKAAADIGTDINLKTNNGKNCLHIAADNGHFNLCKKLISKHSFDVQLPDDDGFSALHYFVKEGSYDLVKAAAALGTCINLKTNNGKNCLHIASEYGHFNLCRTLISKHNFDVKLPDNNGWTVLHYFARNGSYELVKAAADMGTDINLKTNNGENCLHIAAQYGHFDLCWMLISKHNLGVQLPYHYGWTALHYFAQNGRYELVKAVADMGTNINLKTNTGENCLHIAAEYGHSSLCWTLISKHNFDVQIPDDDGWTVLHYFAENGSYDLVKAVVNMGIDINVETDNGKNCLHIAADNSHFDLCRTLISKHNFDVQLRDHDGWTAFHYFAKEGSYELVKAAADMGIHINLPTNKGKNCLHIAADNSHFDLCRTLISKHNFDVQLRDHDGWTAFHYFAKEGSYELVKAVADMGIHINLPTNKGKNCLHIAADNSHFDLCRTLISKHNFDVQLRDHDGWTALHYFAKRGSYELVKAVADLGVDINLKTDLGKNCLHIAADNSRFSLCRMLTSKHNFEVQIGAHDGWSALHYFAQNGSYELVKAAADMGINIKLTTNNGKNCLHIASEYGHFNLCRTLISKHNFDVKLPDNNGWAVLHYFARNGSYELVKAAADMGTDINLKTNNGENCLHIAAQYGHFDLCWMLISKHNLGVQLPYHYGWTALHYFAQNGRYELVKAVADMGTNINLKTNTGENCLHIAAEYGHSSLCWTLISKHNFKVQIPNDDGWTVLHYFAENGSYDLVKAVVNMGIDINVETDNGKNCLHIAADNSHVDLCRTLISKHNFDVQLRDHDGWTAFHYFAKEGSYELVKAVADMGIHINLPTNKGKNCLHIAADNSHFDLCRTLISKHNFDVQLRDHDGWTAFHYFAKEGSYELVKAVADIGIHINLPTNKGKNCLHIAADNSHFHLCRTLISKHNFDVQLRDHDGWTALHYFAKRGSDELVKVAADMGINIKLTTNNGKNCLHIASEYGNFHLCRTLISKHNFDVKLPDNNGWTVLHYFTRNGSYELVKAAADMGTDINLKTNNGENCLHIAAQYGHFDLCWMLISKHNLGVQLPYHYGWTALHYFAQNGRYELVKAVADMGTNINLKTNTGENCLHIAAEYGHSSLCWTLISKHNFKVQIPNDDGWTVLHYFAENGSYDLVKAVVNMGIDINVETDNGKNCLHIAADNSHFDLCRTLISKHNFDVQLRDHDGWTAFHYFAKEGSYELVKAVADMGIHINLPTNKGKNCLHIAADNSHFDLCRTLISKHNFDVQLRDHDGWTAFHYFAKEGSYELVKAVADIGIHINLPTNKGKNCLHIAADNSHFDLCRTLISKHNFDVQLRDHDGWTALHYFAQNGSYELVKAAADMGINIKLTTNNGKNCLHIASEYGNFHLCRTLISKHNFDVKLPDNNGWTVLHYFARNGSYELVKAAADMGTDINLKTNNGENCLHIAAQYGHFDLCWMLISKHNLGVQLPYHYGWTALHYFAQNGRYELVKAVADMGTNINLKTNTGENCLHIAAEYGHSSLCWTLISKHKFDVQIPDDDGWTVLHYFAQNGSYELVKAVADMGIHISLPTNKGKNCLHIAADNSHFDLCRTLISKHNFDVQLCDHDGWTAFHYFAKEGSYELVKAVADLGVDITLKTNLGKNCLHIAADSSRFNLCRMLISKHNFDMQLRDRNGWTALHYFARNGYYELVKAVADMGININLTTNNGKNCLHIAADNSRLNLCRALIRKHNCDVELPDHDGWAALHYFAKKGSYELVKAVADMGIHINLPTNKGKNCLHIAADNSHFHLCRTLISKHNFDVQLSDHDGWTALHYFAKRGSYELVEAVADLGVDINLETNLGKNCLHIAADNGRFNLCKKLISKHSLDVQLPDDDGFSALHYFARKGSYELVKAAADMGINIKLTTNNGKNCLHIASEYGNFHLCRTLISKHNFDVKLPDNDGWTVLHYFARNGSYELVKAAADMGTDINLKTNNGENCLHIAAQYGHFDLCWMLISKHNLGVQLPYHYGWTALHYFAQNGRYELVKAVADIGTNINLKANTGENCLHIAAEYGHSSLCWTLISKHKFDVQIPDDDGWTVLHYFAKNGSYELVKAAVDMGIDINVKTDNGQNCLHIAADNSRWNLCRTLIRKHEFDVELPDHDGWTALHYFAKKGSYELVEGAADMGTVINLKTNNGKNCLHIAAEYGHFHLCWAFIGKSNFDAQLPDHDGWTALHYFAQNGSYELVNAVVDMGIDIVNLKTNNGMNCLHIATKFGHMNLCKVLIEKYNFDVRIATSEERTLLHFSAINGSFALFSYILGKGSEMFCKTSKMENVLHFASFWGHFSICKFVLECFIKDFKDNNIKNQYTLNGKSYSSEIFYKYKTIFLHAMDVDGNTYLHLAAKGNKAKVCKLLLRYDTEIITLLNKKDETARDIAKNRGYENVLNALKTEYERSGKFF